MATSSLWPELENDILARMPSAAEQPIASGELIDCVQQLHPRQPPSRDTIRRALEQLELQGYVGKSGEARARKWWKTGKPRAANGVARRPPLELAIALLTLQRHAPNHLPSHVTGLLTEYFTGAEKVLQESPVDPTLVDARAWATKTVRIDAGYPFVSPPVESGILNEIRRALYATKVLSVSYRNSRLETAAPASYEVVPLALVERGPVLYVVASRRSSSTGAFRRYQLRLDRFVDATCTDVPGEPDPAFDLDAYVRHNQFFSFFPQEPIRIALRVREDVGLRDRFREQRLSDDQCIEEEAGGFRLSATVIPSVELRNLLMERAARVEVLAPAELRAEIAQGLRQACRYYDDLPAQP